MVATEGAVHDFGEVVVGATTLFAEGLLKPKQPTQPFNVPSLSVKGAYPAAQDVILVIVNPSLLTVQPVI